MKKLLTLLTILFSTLICCTDREYGYTLYFLVNKSGKDLVIQTFNTAFDPDKLASTTKISANDSISFKLSNESDFSLNIGPTADSVIILREDNRYLIFTECKVFWIHNVMRVIKTYFIPVAMHIKMPKITTTSVKKITIERFRLSRKKPHQIAICNLMGLFVKLFL
jgi:hypothetical protein